MSILIQSRVPATPPARDRDVWAWDIPGERSAVVLDLTPSGYRVGGRLLFPHNPFASEPLNAMTDVAAIVEARNHVVAVLIRRAEETMALASAFAGEVEDDAKLKLDRAEIAAAVAVALGELTVGGGRQLFGDSE